VWGLEKGEGVEPVQSRVTALVPNITFHLGNIYFQLTAFYLHPACLRVVRVIFEVHRTRQDER
jgi:DUF1365 family protein